jgi:hypothetical protein
MILRVNRFLFSANNFWRELDRNAKPPASLEVEASAVQLDSITVLDFVATDCGSVHN